MGDGKDGVKPTHSSGRGSRHSHEEPKETFHDIKHPSQESTSTPGIVALRPAIWSREKRGKSHFLLLVCCCCCCYIAHMSRCNADAMSRFQVMHVASWPGDLYLCVSLSTKTTKKERKFFPIGPSSKESKRVALMEFDYPFFFPLLFLSEARQTKYHPDGEFVRSSNRFSLFLFNLVRPSATSVLASKTNNK